MTIQLKDVKPDFDALVQKLNAGLKDTASWRDMYAGSVGQTLTEFFAAVGTYSQHSIASLFRETFLDTAVRPTSVYAIARMLGVHVSRKLSPHTTLTLTREGSLAAPFVVPKWTVFSVGNQQFVTVQPVLFDVGQVSVNVTVYAGNVRTVSFTSDGSNFQEYIIAGSAPFSVSDQHIEVRVANRTWGVTQRGLWDLNAGQRIVNDSTSSAGDLVLLFGNDVNGVAPNPNEIVTVKFLDTLGMQTEEVSVNTTVNSPFPTVSGRVLTPLIGGASEKSLNFYRTMASHMFSGNKQASTPKQYEAVTASYPGVVDSKIFPQRDLDPNDIRLMNVIHVSLLIEGAGAWSEEVDPPTQPTFYALVDGGYLVPDTYSYRITSVNDVGESTASVAATYALSTPGSLLLQWDPAPNAVAYRVYGRGAGVEQLLMEVRPEETAVQGKITWIDDGTMSPLGLPPTVNSTRASWWTFKQWMEERKHSSVHLVQMNPVPEAVPVKLVVYVNPSTENFDDLRSRIYKSIVALFKPDLGTIGRKLAVSDLSDAARVVNQAGDSDVDYVEVLSPLDDVEPASRVGYLYASAIEISIVFTDRPARF